MLQDHLVVPLLTVLHNFGYFSAFPVASRITLRSMWHTSRVALVSWAICMHSLPTTPMQSEYLHRPAHAQVHVHTRKCGISMFVLWNGAFTWTVKRLQRRLMSMLWIFNLSSSQISSSFDRNGEKNAEYFTHKLLLYQNVCAPNWMNTNPKES